MKKRNLILVVSLIVFACGCMSACQSSVDTGKKDKNEVQADDKKDETSEPVQDNVDDVEDNEYYEDELNDEYYEDEFFEEDNIDEEFFEEDYSEEE